MEREIMKPELAPAELKPAFVAAAKQADQKIRGAVSQCERLYIQIGGLCDEFSKNRYHVALGYPTFGDYIEEVFQKSASQLYQAMRIVRKLVRGDNPVLTQAEANKITRANAEHLIDLHERGVKITGPIKKAAMVLPASKFKETIVEPTLRRRPPAAATSTEGHTGQSPVAPEREMAVLRECFGAETIAEYNEVMKIALWVAREDREDINRQIPLREKAFQAIMAEFRSTYEAEYLGAMQAMALSEEWGARIACERLVEEEHEFVKFDLGEDEPQLH
jgi:hypothetical protein